MRCQDYEFDGSFDTATRTGFLEKGFSISTGEFIDKHVNDFDCEFSLIFAFHRSLFDCFHH